MTNLFGASESEALGYYGYGYGYGYVYTYPRNNNQPCTKGIDRRHQPLAWEFPARVKCS